MPTTTSRAVQVTQWPGTWNGSLSCAVHVFIYMVSSTGAEECFVPARQELYSWDTSQALCLILFFETGSQQITKSAYTWSQRSTPLGLMDVYLGWNVRWNIQMFEWSFIGDHHHAAIMVGHNSSTIKPFCIYIERVPCRGKRGLLPLASTNLKAMGVCFMWRPLVIPSKAFIWQDLKLISWCKHPKEGKPESLSTCLQTPDPQEPC